MLPKTSEYALRAVVWLGSSEASVPAEPLSKSTKAPRRYLHTVLQQLVQAELVVSQPGPGGGYRLAKDPAEITILDVVTAVADLQRIRSCPLGLSSHTRLCPLHKKLDDAYAATEKAFREVTIAQLLRSTSKIKPLLETP
ncbi:MAG: Rrf2 family transcriptional regulator [Planctomycetaceae bacterium]|nr:Rrf2 family transcriptional regulator [Planctomycetaceae bacterium]